MADTAVADAIRAAGAVLWRRDPDGVRVALVHRPEYDDWSFAKGKLDSGEHLLHAVRREVAEETGLSVRLGRRLPPAWYTQKGRPKRVDYWSATVEAGTFTPNDEVDRLDWLTVPEALVRLSYPRDAELLERFAAGPLHTTPLVIMRHASAGDKDAWADDDALRPLDDRGRTQATVLADVLTGYFGASDEVPPRLAASATARCVESLLPLARRVRAEVVTERSFTVGRSSSGRAREVLTELAADGRPAVICTHGELVTDLIIGLSDRLGAEPPTEPTLPKGGFWVAHLATDEVSAVTGIAALERHDPP